MSRGIAHLKQTTLAQKTSLVPRLNSNIFARKTLKKIFGLGTRLDALPQRSRREECEYTLAGLRTWQVFSSEPSVVQGPAPRGDGERPRQGRWTLSVQCPSRRSTQLASDWAGSWRDIDIRSTYPRPLDRTPTETHLDVESVDTIRDADYVATPTCWVHSGMHGTCLYSCMLAWVSRRGYTNWIPLIISNYVIITSQSLPGLRNLSHATLKNQGEVLGTRLCAH